MCGCFLLVRLSIILIGPYSSSGTIFISLVLNIAAGYTSYRCMGEQKQWHNTRDVVKEHDPCLSESHSVSSKERASSSTEDVNNEREVPSSGSVECDDCYADPVDAINEFLRDSKPSSSPSDGLGSNELTNDDSPVFPASEELTSQQASKEQQLQMFHQRLFKANSDGNELLKKIEMNGDDDSEAIDEPTYSNPFDALAANSRRPFKVTTDKLKRNASMSPNPWQLQQHPSDRNGSPPPPVPSRDIFQKPVRYARREIGEDVGGNSAPGKPTHVQVPHVWQRSNSNRGKDKCPPSPTQRAPEGQVPVSVSERLRQLRQQSQSDGVPLDPTCLQPRPPMPLPVLEQNTAEVNVLGQVQLCGQPQHPVHYNSKTNGVSGKNLRLDVRNDIKQKAMLERSNSDSMNHQHHYARHGMAKVLPLSAREIVQKHMSHVAY